jgi:decaprenyl-phosphate phosphoribosyltransferase
MSAIDSVDPPNTVHQRQQQQKQQPHKQAMARHGGDRPSLTVDLVTLIRPAHAIKSFLAISIALVDAHDWSLAALGRAAWAAIAFSLAAACVYVCNDIADRRRDAQHPVKCHRPIAPGRISVKVGVGYLVGLLIALGVLIGTAPDKPYWPIVAYLGLNVGYSCGLKHIPLIDVSVVALGFALRIIQGYVAIRQDLSGWLLVTIFSLSLLLVIGKRRRELVEAGSAHRPALRGYSVELANHLLQLTGVLSVVAALIYLRTEAPFGSYGQAAMLLSTPFALFAHFRYMQLLLVDSGGGDPVRTLLRDRALLSASALWAITLGGALMVAHHPALTQAIPF